MRVDLDSRPGNPEPLSSVWERSHAFRMEPQSSALVIVDLQYGSASTEYGYASAYRQMGHGDTVAAYLDRISNIVVPSVQKLQAAFREIRAPVVFLVFGTIAGDFSDMPPRYQRGAEHWLERGIDPPYARQGSQAMQVLDEVAPLPNEAVITKTSASGFTASILDPVLNSRHVRSIAFCGVATSHCVESTLRDASDRGYDVVLVEDGCADITTEGHERGVRSCRPFGRVAKATEVVAELRSAISA